MDNKEKVFGLDLFEDEFATSHGFEGHEALFTPFVNNAYAFKDSSFKPEDKDERPLDTYPKDLRYEALRRLSYIQWFEKRISGGWTKKNLKPLLDKADFSSCLDGPIPSWRTLASWHSAYKNNGCAVESLVPQHYKKGKKIGKLADDECFFWRAMNEKYLRRERPSILSAYIYYCDLITLKNSGLVAGKLKAISQRSFYYRVSKLSPYEVDRARYGKQYADRKYKTIGAHARPTKVLERVEIDHTALDLMLLDDNIQVLLGRPYITALIDSFSKCLVGFYIGYKEPGYESVRKALLHAMLNKEHVKEKYPAVSCEWPCEGKIETLVVDNGAEFWSENLESACRSFVSNIQYNRVAHPWLKPLIERFFGQINQKLLVSIPGKTFSGIPELEGYNPEKDAVMRFSTFMDIFHKWVVDVYHQGPNSRGDHVPIIKWKQGVKELPPLVYRGDDERRVMMDLAPSIERVLGREGVRFAGLSYTCEILDEFRRSSSPLGKHKGTKVLVKIDPNDLSKVYVFLPGKKSCCIANAVDPDGYTLGLSLFQHQTNRRFQRKFNSYQVDHIALAEARIYIEDRINKEFEFIKNQSKNKKKASGMKKIARYKNVGSDGCFSVSNEIAEVDKDRQVEVGRPKLEGEGEHDLSKFDDWDSHIAAWEPY